MKSDYQNIPAGVYNEPGGGTKTVYETHDMPAVPVQLHRDTVVGHCSIANWHENLEVLLFLEGKGRVYFEEKKVIEFSVGDFCVINCGELHRVESANDEKCSYFCLIIDEYFCKQQGIFAENVQFTNRISDADLVLDYHKIAEAFDSRNEYRLLAVKGALLSFMARLLSYHTRMRKAPDHSSATEIHNAIRYIRTHYAEEMTLDSLAAFVGLSKYYFLREFKRITGMTVIRYINAVRIEHAVRLFKAENATVSTVAEAVGFGNHSYFCKMFSRITGVTPSEFIKTEKRQKRTKPHTT